MAWYDRNVADEYDTYANKIIKISPLSHHIASNALISVNKIIVIYMASYTT